MISSLEKLKRIKKKHLDHLCLEQALRLQEKQKIVMRYDAEKSRIKEAASYASTKPIYSAVFEDFRRVSEERCWQMEQEILEKQNEIVQKQWLLTQAFRQYSTLDLWLQHQAEAAYRIEEKEGQALLDQWNALSAFRKS